MVAAVPDALAASLRRLGRETIDLYQHHFPSRGVDIPTLMGLMANAVEGGQGPGHRGQQLFGVG